MTSPPSKTKTKSMDEQFAALCIIDNMDASMAMM
jgi:hypothetical protein